MLESEMMLSMILTESKGNGEYLKKLRSESTDYTLPTKDCLYNLHIYFSEYEHSIPVSNIYELSNDHGI